MQCCDCQNLATILLTKQHGWCRFPAWTQLKTVIPPILQYPIGDESFQFASALVSMFYAPSLGGNIAGLKSLLLALLPSKSPKAQKTI